MDGDAPLLDWMSARAARDAALEKGSLNNLSWHENGLEAIAKLAHKIPPFTGERLRFALVTMIGAPEHPNAWGALVMDAIKKGLFADTGKWERMMSEKSNHRKTTVYDWP